ncbi:protein TolR [Roseococcus sp. SDR]|uniref:protein TolR n=1 Tax=Roseococcus sp. SDR TaxID=2835532 RepID=UPI001BCAE135|nr:protein TolR [Roseococcus sp. SDR]MBS7792347.1 protein TolR [Roseococcus sp. SDR]MBV1847661.1 protein TolR [Roseococcus sp. SDR]
MAMTPLGAPSEDEDAPPMSEINVTPFVDVMLVLLVIFMVAAPMMMVGVPVQLPQTAAPRIAQTAPPVVITLARDGRVFLRQEEVPEAELAARIRSLREAEANEAPVYVRGDRAVPYGDVMRVMGRVTAAGVTRVSLIAEEQAAGAAIQAR